MHKTWLAGVCMVASFGCMFLYSKDELTVLTVMLIVSAAMIAANWSVEHLVVYMGLLLGGAAIEATAVYLGVWYYPTHNYLSFPLWVPFIWSNGALFLIEFKEVVDTSLARRRRRA